MKIKTTGILFAATIILLLMPFACAADHVIKTEEDLKKIGTGEFGLNDSYILAENITVRDTVWNSIGCSDCPFTGAFDGNNKTITFCKDVTLVNEKRNENENSSEITGFNGFGLFGNIENAHIKDICLIICNMTTEDPKTETDYEILPTGPLAGFVSGEGSEIKDCRVYKAMTGTGIIYSNTGAGGLVGMADAGLINNCTSQADVTAGAAAGGLIGMTKEAAVSNSSSVGDVSAEIAAGGFIGTVAGASVVINNSADGNVTAFDGRSGTFIGDIIAAGGKFIYCESNGLLNIVSDIFENESENEDNDLLL